ncbi:hypothetical protein ACHAPJ_013220 [Fusarium lateritium]
MVTDELDTSSTLRSDLSSTASTASFPTSSSIDEPAGRSIILLVSLSVPDNERRDLNKRANGGFVGTNNPDVCTFAAVFNLAQGQLFDGGVPVYYSGEAFKELAGKDRPSGDSITKTFTTSRGYLVFKNSGLPNGVAGFCQDSNGKVYITFTAGPPGCVPVDLGFYDIEQCQNGRLVGAADLTSISTEIGAPETAIPEALSSEGVTSIEDTSAVEETQSAESNSDSPLLSTSTIQSASFETASRSTESVKPTSQTSEPKTSVMDSSSATDLSAILSSFTTTIPTVEASTARLSFFSSIVDDSSIESSSSTESEGSISPASTSSDMSGSSTIGDETTISNILEMTSEITSSVETSAIDTTTTTDVTVISEPETTTVDTTTNTDTTTAEDLTAIGETTIAAISTTTSLTPIPTLANPTCSDLDSPYKDPSGASFDLTCNASIGYAPLRIILVDSFTACIKFCAEDTQCAGLLYEKSRRGVCRTFLDSFGGFSERTDSDVARRIPEDENGTTTNAATTTTEDPTTTADTTTAALFTTCVANPVPQFVRATCSELDSRYQDPIGVSFKLSCDTYAWSYREIYYCFAEVLTECVWLCAQDEQCVSFRFDRPANQCIINYGYDGAYPDDPRMDSGVRVSEEGNPITTEDQTTTENPTTTADTTAAVSTTTSAASVPPFVEATCTDVYGQYDDPIGPSFDVLCQVGTFGGINLGVFETDIFTACVRYCAQDGRCTALQFDKEASVCYTYVEVATLAENTRFDAAVRIFTGGGR